MSASVKSSTIQNSTEIELVRHDLEQAIRRSTRLAKLVLEAAHHAEECERRVHYCVCILRKIEWSGRGRCLFCGVYEPGPHALSCELGEALE